MLHCYTSPCQSTIDPCYTNTPHKSAQRICELCYMWNLCGVVVCHGSIDRWVHLQSVYMCILLYMKLIWCNGLACIYCQLTEGLSICHWSICTFSNIWNWCGIMVLHAPMVNWLGVYLPLVHMCIVLCVKLIWCNGFPDIYAQLEGGPSAFSIYVDSPMCEAYWCNGLACSYGQLQGGPSAFGIHVHSPTCETY